MLAGQCQRPELRIQGGFNYRRSGGDFLQGAKTAVMATFQMRSSDPDFPFDIEALDCVLRVPFDYSESGKPSLTVKNPNMERGYQIDVERGFEAIVANARASTLLNHMDALDKQLEAPLVAQKAATIKIISNLRKPEKPPSGILPKYELPHLLNSSGVAAVCF